MLNIPIHKNCKNCGKCCGTIPATPEEISKIVDYINENDITPSGSYKSTCPFRDNRQKKCLIYPVRPLICRLFGVTKGNMNCPHGNSADIDGRKFLAGIDPNTIKFLNHIDWRKERRRADNAKQSKT
ncbi:MAG: YkgJ family cysteine cluster protein [Huintestinicola sp.]